MICEQEGGKRSLPIVVVDPQGVRMSRLKVMPYRHLDRTSWKFHVKPRVKILLTGGPSHLQVVTFMDFVLWLSIATSDGPCVSLDALLSLSHPNPSPPVPASHHPDHVVVCREPGKRWWGPGKLALRAVKEKGCWSPLVSIRTLT